MINLFDFTSLLIGASLILMIIHAACKILPDNKVTVAISKFAKKRSPIYLTVGIDFLFVAVLIKAFTVKIDWVYLLKYFLILTAVYVTLAVAISMIYLYRMHKLKKLEKVSILNVKIVRGKWTEKLFYFTVFYLVLIAYNLLRFIISILIL